MRRDEADHAERRVEHARQLDPRLQCPMRGLASVVRDQDLVSWLERRFRWIA
jgi:hypothetical protein